VKPAEHPPLSFSFAYFLAVVGGSLFGTKTAAIAAAVFVLSILAVALVQLIYMRQLRPNSFWLTLLVFSLLVEGAIMTGRSGFGTGSAMVSRYATFAILTVSGVYGLVSSLLIGKRNWLSVTLFTALAGLIMISFATAAEAGFYEGKVERSVREASALALASCERPPAQAANLYPNIDRLHKQVAVMRELRISTFDDPGLGEKYDLPFLGLTPLSRSTELQVENPTIFPNDNAFVVGGWAFDSANNNVAGGVQLRIDGKVFPAYYGLSRRDVADRFKNPRLEFSGFSACLPLRSIGTGSHKLAISVLSHDGRALFRPQQMGFQLQ
jgi:hypothetical protein